jgi:hypothetical protein
MSYSSNSTIVNRFINDLLGQSWVLIVLMEPTRVRTGITVRDGLKGIEVVYNLLERNSPIFDAIH